MNSGFRMLKAMEIWGLLKETFVQWQEDNAMQWAAALAFYTIFSLTPILIIAIAIASVVFGPDAVHGRVIAQFRNAIGPEGARVVQNLLIESGPQSSVATAVGVGTLLFGATVVFSALQEALNAIWEVVPKPGKPIRMFFKKRLLCFLLVLLIGFLLLISLVGSAALSITIRLMGDSLPLPSWLLQTMSFVVSFALASLVFAIVYKVLPDVKIAWSDVWIGAVFTSLLFNLGKWLIWLYLSSSGIESAYGAAGSFVVFLLWVYYSAQIFFFGGEFTQVYARKYGSGIAPDNNAVRIMRNVNHNA